MTSENLTPGSIFDGRFEIRAIAGRGGMGTVYRARHINLQREVALKVSNLSAILTAEQLKRFQQEARLASSLKHQNICGVDSFGTCDGLPYVAFEFLDGRSLEDIVDARQIISFVRFVRLFVQVCEGLQYAHENSVLHRDLKPANIFVVNAGSENETAKIVDFGIAKVLQTNPDENQRLTATGHILGTPLYMSPEQSRCEPLDARSDIYSLGCLMYYCIAGKPPFEAESAYELLLAHQSAVPPDVALPRDYPSSVWNIILRCLAKQPADRYASAADVARDLKLSLEGKGIGPTLQQGRSRHKSPRIRKSVVIGVCAIFTVVSLSAIAVFKNGQTDGAARGDFSKLSADIKEACARRDFATASRLLGDNKDNLFKFPSAEAAELCHLAAMNQVSGSKTDTDKFFDPTWRILRAMPEDEWSKPAAMTALRGLRTRFSGNDAYPDVDNPRAIDAGASMFVGVWAPILHNQGSPRAEESVCREALHMAEGLTTCSPRLMQALWRSAYTSLSEGRDQIAEEIARFCVQHTATTDGYQRLPSEALLADVFAAEGKELECRALLESVVARIKGENVPENEQCGILFRLAASYAASGDKKKAREIFSEMQRYMDGAPTEDTLLRFAGPVASGFIAIGDKPAAVKLLASSLPQASQYLSREENIDSRVIALHAFGRLLLGPEKAGAEEMSDYQKRKDRKLPGNYRVLDIWADMVTYEAGVVQAFNEFLGNRGAAAKEECVDAISNAAFYRSAWRPRLAVDQMEKTLAIIEAQHSHGLSNRLDSHIRMHTAQVAALLSRDPEFVDKEFAKAAAVSDAPSDVMTIVLTQWAQIQRERGQLDAATSTIEKAIAQKDNHSKTRAVSEACAIYARQGRWERVCELGETVEDSQLSRPERSEWMRRWAEPYTMALRKLGHSAKADRLIETVERKIQHSSRPTES